MTPSSWHRRCLLLMLSVTAAVSAQERGKAYDPGQPKFAYRLDEVAHAAGLQPLRDLTGPEPRREIRLWEGFGLFAPEELVRIVQDSGGVRGSHLFWWPPNDPESETAADRDTNLISNAELFASLRKGYGCGRFRRTPEYEMCEATLPRGQTWAGILAQLDSLGVAALPDQSQLDPPGGIGLDGFTLVVEIRDHGHYRAYSYWSPVPDAPQPQVRTAAAIVGVMSMVGAHD
jgi:hypothetical protein